MSRDGADKVCWIFFIHIKILYVNYLFKLDTLIKFLDLSHSRDVLNQSFVSIFLLEWRSSIFSTRIWKPNCGGPTMARTNSFSMNSPQNIQKIKPFEVILNYMSHYIFRHLICLPKTYSMLHTAIKFCFRKMRLVMFAKAEKMKTKSRIWKEKFSILSPSFELFKTWLYLVLLVTRPLFSSKSKFFKLNFDWIETLMRDKIFWISVENRGRSRNRPAWNGQSSIWKR